MSRTVLFMVPTIIIITPASRPDKIEIPTFLGRPADQLKRHEICSPHDGIGRFPSPI